MQSTVFLTVKYKHENILMKRASSILIRRGGFN